MATGFRSWPQVFRVSWPIYYRSESIFRVGQADANSNLGLVYYKGDGVVKDMVQAVKFITFAIEVGEPHCRPGKPSGARALLHEFHIC